MVGAAEPRDDEPARARLLLVDDHEDNLLLLSETLDDPSYELVLASSGEQALELARRVVPDIVLLDLRMPGINGHETCRRLKADPRTAGAPVLFLSATDSVDDRVAGFAAGAVDFVAKPFDPDEVIARVRTHLEIARLTRELSARNLELEREIEAAHAFRRERLEAMMAPLQGHGEAVVQLREQLRGAADSDAPILLRGAVEDGAEAAARAIHEQSSRGWRPFVKFRAPVTPLADSVGLTGPTLSATPALQEVAALVDDGTLYIEGAETLAGSERRYLAQLLERGKLRVIAQHDARSGAARDELPLDTWTRIEIPPVSRRREDIGEIVAYLLRREANKLGKPMPTLAEHDLARLLAYPWPGGLAELASVIRRAVLRSAGPRLTIADLGGEARNLGRYRLQRLLGKGGMGEVWLARHELLPHPVAIKIIAPELGGPQLLEAKRRFSREAFAIARLRSPYTVQIYDFGASDSGELYFAMELLEGLDLHLMVRAVGPLPAARTIHLLRQAASSLAEAHAHGLVHRDIKPPNLIVAQLGIEHDWLKVVDFGVATIEGGRDDDRGFGTPGFVAPELITDDRGPTAASDIYSLGCCAYWCLTGHEPFERRDTSELMRAHAADAPPAPSERVDIPAELDELVIACLAKQPHTRPHARELVDAFDALGRRHVWTREDARRWWADQRGPLDENADEFALTEGL